ncbi:MAG: glutamine--fructose-6-phosphate transaminase (isomerizing) [Patescibacteria group bacterium]
MCGIVGYIGKKNAVPILLDGLKRLEYRGYDSAGLVCTDGKEIESCKAVGKVKKLEKKIKRSRFFCTLGIAHTRWATHGQVCEANTHPHFDCAKKIALVHNGIIENYDKLKKQLISEGHKFESETDTEVIAHLIEKYYSGNLKRAVQKALSYLVGTYGLAIISKDEPDKIVAVRHGSPLVLGVRKNEYFVASDVPAILPFTKKVVYINEGEILEIKKSGFRAFDIRDRKIKKAIKKVKWQRGKIEKGNFPHFMLKEIFEQPQVVRRAMAGRVVLKKGEAHLGGLNIASKELKNIKRILFIACGTANFAGLCGKYIIEELTGIPCDVELASEFRYKRQILQKNTLVFLISQSGETADTIAAMREIQKQRIPVLGISNVVDSTIARETQGGTFIHAGPEIGVASTKAFLGQVIVLVILALEFAKLNGLSKKIRQKIIKGLLIVPCQIEEILRQAPKIKRLAEKYIKYKNFFYLGRKFNYPIALEGALKLKEISYIHAEGYGAGEMKHGPIALVDSKFPVFAIAPQDSVYEKTISNLEEIKARHGKILAVATSGDKKIKNLADDVIYIPKTMEILQPLLTVVPCQLFAYYLAAKKGLDVDKPRNLAKSVTVE